MRTQPSSSSSHTLHEPTKCRHNINRASYSAYKQEENERTPQRAFRRVIKTRAPTR